jgi:adenine-specific DNA-methyltransferase
MNKQYGSHKRDSKGGQFMTTNNNLKDCVKSLILNNPSLILEPSCGTGELLFDEYNYYAVEIDENMCSDISNSHVELYVDDFIKHEFKQSFKTIIGNPPYVCDLVKKFIIKSISLLKDNGELIFIVPINTFTLTSNNDLLQHMYEHGSITHLYNFNDEHLFSNASVSVVVFRYVKGIYNRHLLYCSDYLQNVHPINKEIIISNGILEFKLDETRVSDLFDVYVGYVSGYEKIMKNENGTLQVLTDENQVEMYFDLAEEPESTHVLCKHKNKLMNRKIKKFDETNWFEFGLKRNEQHINDHMNESCIYIRSLTRKDKIAFKGTVQPFSGSLFMLIPKHMLDIDKYIEMFNSEKWKNQYIQSGRFVITHKRLRLAYLKI